MPKDGFKPTARGDKKPELQGELFSLTSPLPGVDLKRELEERGALLTEAREFALEWIHTRHGTAAEFAHSLVERFGFGIRMVIVELVTTLPVDPTLIRIERDYVESALSVSQIEQVFQGKKKLHVDSENTIDELFARSVASRSSEKFIEAVNFVSKLRNYSAYNNMLVYLQRPAATFWATESHWGNAFGRTVKDDAIPLVMLQPMGPVMLTYDVDDTKGKPLPESFTSMFEVTGEFDPLVLQKTIQHCERETIEVRYKRMSFLHAGTAIRASMKTSSTIWIELNKDLDPPALYATMVHELAHIHLGHLGADADHKWPSRLLLNRNQRELEAEAVSYIVCRRAGLTTESAGYLAGYLSNPADRAGVSVDLVLKVARKIEKMGA
jgi:hypothetical protein